MDSLRVLVVDDSLTIRAMVEAIIQNEPGCRVVGVAADVSTARQMLADLLPNVVTLDLAMPGVGGMDFLDELDGHLHAPVVVVSSATRLGSAETDAACAQGAVACFDKARIVSDSRGFLKVLRGAARSKWKARRVPH